MADVKVLLDSGACVEAAKGLDEVFDAMAGVEVTVDEPLPEPERLVVSDEEFQMLLQHDRGFDTVDRFGRAVSYDALLPRLTNFDA